MTNKTTKSVFRDLFFTITQMMGLVRGDETFLMDALEVIRNSLTEMPLEKYPLQWAALQKILWEQCYPVTNPDHWDLFALYYDITLEEAVTLFPIQERQEVLVTQEQSISELKELEKYLLSRADISCHKELTVIASEISKFITRMTDNFSLDDDFLENTGNFQNNPLVVFLKDFTCYGTDSATPENNSCDEIKMLYRKKFIAGFLKAAKECKLTF